MTVIEINPKVESSTLKLTEPGIYDAVPETAYHRDIVEGGSLSSTGSRTLATKTPAHFEHQRRHGRPPKTAFDLGHAFHSDVLGVGGEIAVIDADDYKTKAAREQRDAAYAEGKVPLLRTQADGVQAMAAAVRAHRVAGKLFARTDCRPEVTIIGRDPESGVTCRARLDWLLPIVEGQPIRYVDLKSSDDSSPAGMAKSMTNWGYPHQFDHYSSTLRWALGLPDDYPVIAVLVVVEKEQPHLVGMGQPDEQALAWAHEDNRRARHLYARCTAAGEWPGYSDEVVPLSLPGWRLHQYEQQYPTGLYEPEMDHTLTLVQEGTR